MTPRKNSYRLPKDSSLVLRTCNADMTSYGGFKWKEKGIVKAEDWDSDPKCGNGLHGLLWGQGHGVLLDGKNTSKKWLVLEVKKQLTVDLNGKIKFPECRVVHCGDRDSALTFLFDVRPELQGVVYSTVVSGYGGTSTSGDYGTSTSGDYGTSTSGDYGTSHSGYEGTSTSGYEGTSTSGDKGTSHSGDYGTSISGDYGTSISGDYGTSISGYRGTSTSGYEGTSHSGYGGTSTSGDYGTSTSGDYGTSHSGYEGTSTSGYEGTSTSGDKGTSHSGDYGTSISGDYGTSISGYRGTSTSGKGGSIQIKWWDGKRYRIATGYIGENGLLPNVPYILDKDGQFIEKGVGK